MKEIAYTFAALRDENDIKRLLFKSQLPTDGIISHLKHFILAKSTGGIIGVGSVDFKRLAETSPPAPLQASVEFKTLCPDSAICMRMQLSEQAIYFPRETLTLKSDVLGAKMWGIARKKTLLTFFEVAPHCRFDRHNHESEQITMVLEGELFF